VIVAVVLHYGFRYRFLEGLDAVFANKAVMLNVVGWKALDKVMNGRPATKRARRRCRKRRSRRFKIAAKRSEEAGEPRRFWTEGASIRDLEETAENII
jgi:hypothetical protein